MSLQFKVRSISLMTNVFFFVLRKSFDPSTAIDYNNVSFLFEFHKRNEPLELALILPFSLEKSTSFSIINALNGPKRPDESFFLAFNLREYRHIHV